MRPRGFRLEFKSEGLSDMKATSALEAYFRSVSPEYFTVLALPLAAGRFFHELDQADGERVSIVNLSLVHGLGSTVDPESVVGRILEVDLFEDPERNRVRIVGVVGNTSPTPESGSLPHHASRPATCAFAYSVDEAGADRSSLS